MIMAAILIAIVVVAALMLVGTWLDRRQGAALPGAREDDGATAAIFANGSMDGGSSGWADCGSGHGGGDAGCH